MRLPFLVALLASSLPALAVEDLDVTFHTTDKPNSYAVEVQGIINAPPLAVRHVVLRPCEYKDRYKFMTECVLWHAEGNTALGYTLLDLPIVDPRDYVVVRKVVQDLAPDGTGMMRLEFSEDHTLGPARRKGVVRVEVNQGHYELHPHDGGKKTRITYKLVCSPGGRIPLWMGKLAARRASPETLVRLEAISRELVAKGGAEKPVPGQPWVGVRIDPLTLPLVQASAR